jgi:hypothetical protein
MANQRFGLIRCEAQLNWKDIVSYLADAVEPPRLVTTWWPQLWGEDLNALAQPPPGDMFTSAWQPSRMSDQAAYRLPWR